MEENLLEQYCHVERMADDTSVMKIYISSISEGNRTKVDHGRDGYK